MEDEIRFLYYSAVQEVAELEGYKIVWENPEAETIDNQGNYINQDVANETFFLRPTIKSVTPNIQGLRGWSKYVWNVQISIFVKTDESDLVAARVVDALRESFVFGDHISGTDHKYQQVNHIDLKPSIPMGAWKSYPALFKVMAVG